YLDASSATAAMLARHTRGDLPDNVIRLHRDELHFRARSGAEAEHVARTVDPARLRRGTQIQPLKVRLTISRTEGLATNLTPPGVLLEPIQQPVDALIPIAQQTVIAGAGTSATPLRVRISRGGIEMIRAVPREQFPRR